MNLQFFFIIALFIYFCFYASTCFFDGLSNVSDLSILLKNGLTCFMLFLIDQQVLTAIGNFCICSIAVGMVIEIIVMFPIQDRPYRPGIDNLLVLLIGGIPIAMPTVLSVTMAIGSHRLSQQVCTSALMLLFYLMCSNDPNIL